MFLDFGGSADVEIAAIFALYGGLSEMCGYGLLVLPDSTKDKEL